MSLIRPEICALIWRWREVLVAAGIAVIGLWLLFFPGWIIQALGVLIAGVAVLAGLLALRRMRFGAGGGGPGVVEVIEGQIGYFGPISGGSVGLSSLTRLTFDTRRRSWVLHRDTDAPLHIPANSTGAEALFDLFAALPGLDSGRLLAALAAPPGQIIVIWQRTETHRRLS